MSEPTTAKKTAKKRKILNIIVDIVIYLFFALCILFLIFTVASKKSSDDAVNVFGYQMRTVITGSMEKDERTDVSEYKIKDLPVGCVIFIKPVPSNATKADAWFAKLKVGDVLTFQWSAYVSIGEKTPIITHRIVAIEEKTPGNPSGGYIIRLEGDYKGDSGSVAQQVIDTSERDTSLNYIIGKVTGKSYVLGQILTFMKKPIGIALIIIVPCTILILFQIIKIVNVINAGKRKKAEDKAKAQEDELEELRRRLAALEGASPTEDAENTPTGECVEKD